MKNKILFTLLLSALAPQPPAAAQNSFATAATLSAAAGVTYPAQVTAIDINADGKLDLICANSVLTNNGKGGFTSALQYQSPAFNVRASGWVAADVLGHGRIDLITLTNLAVSPYTESIVVYTNSGPSSTYPYSFTLGFHAATTNVGNATATQINGSYQGNGSLVNAGDVDGNGRMNLFYYNSVSNTVALFTNNGSGSFGSNTTFNLKMGPPVVADVNGDGKLDFISPWSSNNLVYIFTNNGSGSFGSNAALNVRSPVFVLAADVNGDGWVDLVCQSTTNNLNQYTNTISIWTNNGSGSFGSNATFLVGSKNQKVTDIKAAKVFGDGRLDLIFAVSDVVSESANALIVYTNNGFGGFGSNLTVNVGNDTQPAAVAIADVNGDGNLDLISANAGYLGGAYGLTIFTNTGSGIQSGSFSSNSMPLLTTNYSAGLLAADIYRNGKPVLLNEVYPASLLVQTNDGTGNFGSNALESIPLPANYYALVPFSADLYGNSDPALIFGLVNQVSSLPGFVLVATNNGAGVFGTNALINIGTAPFAVTAADVNGDSKLDLIVCGYSGTSPNYNYSLLVMTNNGSGGFATNVSLPLNALAQLAVADVNGDGRLDIIVAYNYQSYSRVVVFTNLSPAGIGPLFSTAASTTYQVTLGDNPAALIPADVNGDGKVDLIIANNNNPGTLSVLTNNGSGGFGLNASPSVGMFPHALVAADVNSDGKVDLVSANWGLTTNTVTDLRGPLGYGTVTVLLNNGTGGFTNVSTFSVGTGPTALLAMDVNGDGKLDLITANTTSFTNQGSVLGTNWYGLGYKTLSILLNTSNFVNTVQLQSAPSATAITYGQTLSASSLSGGAVTNAAGASVAGNFTFTTNALPPAGTPNVSVTFTPTPPTDYQPSSILLGVTVYPLPVVLTGSRAYDGTTNVGFGNLSVANKVGSDNVTVAAGSVGLAAATVGTNPITATNGLVLGGSAAGNYLLAGVNGAVSITPASPAITLNSSMNPAGYGAAVNFSARLPAYATGTILFLTNGVNFDLENLVNGSASSVATTTLPLGLTGVAASYSGDANDLAATNDLSQLINAPQFNSVFTGAGGLVFSGAWGTSNGTYRLLATTNLTLPAGQWTTMLTNQFDANGNFLFTNPVNLIQQQMFFLLQSQ